MQKLGTLEELPLAYRQGLTALNLVPLWPSLRSVLPHDMPSRRTRPTLWRYADVRPQLLQAGDLTPMEKAERRVLVLANPGHGLENMQATASIYIGLQLILPHETAPNHRHTPSAVRFVIEGEGGFTVVEGEKLPMERGDLILTPPWLWHEHGHHGSGPVIWLDALDLPMIYNLELSYVEEAGRQNPRDTPDVSQTRFRRAGLAPYETLDAAKPDFPLLRFPWRDVSEGLRALASVTSTGVPVRLAYINPQTGNECLPTMGFSALMLRPGETLKLDRRSASMVLHVIEGEGQALVDNVGLSWDVSDTFAVPTHAEITLANRSAAKPAFLFVIDDAPLQRRLGIYQTFPYDTASLA
jgi:gentisate 1,2-dioxygenase